VATILKGSMEYVLSLDEFYYKLRIHRVIHPASKWDKVLVIVMFLLKNNYLVKGRCLMLLFYF